MLGRPIKTVQHEREECFSVFVKKAYSSAAFQSMKTLRGCQQFCYGELMLWAARPASLADAAALSRSVVRIHACRIADAF
jgi:hypothetical protein